MLGSFCGRDGSVKVDTNAGGFTVTDLPLQTKLTVIGKVAKRGATRVIYAQGIATEMPRANFPRRCARRKPAP
jgi:hypothetical protein